MKAIIHTKYGPPADVLELKEVEKPTPKNNEVLVKIHASSINYANPTQVRGKPFIIRLMGSGLFKPKNNIPGGDISGVVEAVGKDVTRFKPGDEVFGDLADDGFGAYAEYVSAPEKTIANKPANVSHEESAVASQASVVALQGLRNEGQIQSGQKVLIVGSSGGVGTYAIQLAKSFGAEVTAVCSTGNMELVRSLGADNVIDYTKEDFVKNGQNYDLILATVGYRSIFDYKKALSPTGTYVATGGTMAQIFQPMLLGGLLSKKGGQSFKGLFHKTNRDDLFFIKDLIEANKLKSIIDKRYSINDIVPALEYYEEGHTRGKVAITIDHNKKTK
jgi:NADPH:quinone reductase-like Zn-dependent oxidoreductase